MLGPYFQLDDFSVSGYPGPQAGPLHALPPEDCGTADGGTGESLILWHRDSFNMITQVSHAPATLAMSARGPAW